MSDTPDRAQPELTELNLLLEQHAQEGDPKRKEALRKQIEEMEGEVGEANSQ